jgi:hypothetical protein
VVVEQKLDATRIFNMDETSFLSKSSSKKVVAVKGSSNVWCRKEEPGFHLTIVACVRADGKTIPPLFILPSIRLYRNILDECVVENAKVTTDVKGFINGSNLLSLKIYCMLEVIDICQKL